MVLSKCTLAFVFCLSVVTAQPLFAQSNVSIGSGTTTLQLDPSFEATLSTNGLTFQALEETSLFQGMFILPVIEGVIDLDSARGDILLSGGLGIAGQSVDVRFYNFSVNTTTATPLMTADLVVNNAMIVRMALFDLQLPPLTLPLDARSGTLIIPSTPVLLRDDAAFVLNQIFQSSMFSGGALVGTSQMTFILGQSGL